MLHHMTHLPPATPTTMSPHGKDNPTGAVPSPSPPASATRPLHHDAPPPSPATCASAGCAARKIPTATSVAPMRFIQLPLLDRQLPLPLLLSSSAPAGPAAQPCTLM